MTPLRILIADDNEMFQDLIERFLRALEGVSIIGIVHNGEDAVSGVQEHHPDIVIIDLSMPNKSSVKAPKAIKEQFPETRVYLCSAFPDYSLETSVQELGVDGYISKTELKKGLTEMVKKERERKQ